MTGKRSARAASKLVDPTSCKNASLETPRAPEEVKKRLKAAEEAASKSPVKAPNPSNYPSAASGTKEGLRSASKSNQKQMSSGKKGEGASEVDPFTTSKFKLG